MLRQPCKIPVTVIVGATAVGKTAFSIEFAKMVNGEIISADSRYFYRGMDIGTAKPSKSEMNGVAHHLIDIADPNETLSLSKFQMLAYDAALDIFERGKNVIITGGTGQYIRALLDGWTIPEQEADWAMRNFLGEWAEEIGALALHQKLAIIDPAAAEKIEYQNVRRTIRALEVIFKTGARFSDQRKTGDSPYVPLILGLSRPREELYARIDQRIEQMFADGLIEETKNLLNRGYNKNIPSMSAIGYREVIFYLYGKISYDEMIMLMKRRTRDYVRRQSNWFKSDDPAIHWYNMSKERIREKSGQIEVF